MQNVGLGVSLGSDTKEMRQIEIAKITSSKDIYIYMWQQLSYDKFINNFLKIQV